MNIGVLMAARDRGEVGLWVTPGGRLLITGSQPGKAGADYKFLISSLVNTSYSVVVGSALVAAKGIQDLPSYLLRGDILRSGCSVYCLPGADVRLVREMGGKAPVGSGWEAVLTSRGGPLIALSLDPAEFKELACLPIWSVGEGVEEGPVATPWRRKSPTSALLREIDSDRVLLSYRADAAHPPASITKLLTIWLAREKMLAGEVSFTEEVEVSGKAASTGSFWGIGEGERVPIRDLMRAAAIVSSNEAANALAEWHSGSQAKFVGRLNRFGRKIGLHRSRFASPSGLGRAQTTNAHDAGLLAVRFAKERSDVMPFFREKSFSWGGKTGAATNRLIKTMPNATGLKTGTLTPHGYNLTFTAEVGGKGYAAVVLGAGSRAARDRIVRVMMKSVC